MLRWTENKQPAHKGHRHRSVAFSFVARKQLAQPLRNQNMALAGKRSMASQLSCYVVRTLIATQTPPFLIHYGLCLPHPATLNYYMFDPANGMRQDFIDADFDYTELLESVKIPLTFSEMETQLRKH